MPLPISVRDKSGNCSYDYMNSFLYVGACSLTDRDD